MVYSLLRISGRKRGLRERLFESTNKKSRISKIEEIEYCYFERGGEEGEGQKLTAALRR
jgi:hypothetical protein